MSDSVAVPADSAPASTIEDDLLAAFSGLNLDEDEQTPDGEPTVEDEGTETAETDASEPEGEEDEVEESDQEPDADDADEDDDSEGEAEEIDADEPKVDDDFEVEVKGEKIPLGELKQGYMRLADYTRKTQQLASERTELEGQFSEYRSQVDDWVAGMNEDPVSFVSELARATGNHNEFLVELLVAWAADGELDENVADALELTDIKRLKASAKHHAEKREIRAGKLRKEREAEAKDKAPEPQAAEVELQRQMTAVVADAGPFETDADQQKFLTELLTFAIDNQSPTLMDAHTALSEKKKADEAAKVAKARAALNRKKKAAAVSPSGSRGAAAPASARTVEDDLLDAFSALEKKSTPGKKK